MTFLSLTYVKSVLDGFSFGDELEVIYAPSRRSEFQHARGVYFDRRILRQGGEIIGIYPRVKLESGKIHPIRPILEISLARIIFIERSRTKNSLLTILTTAQES